MEAVVGVLLSPLNGDFVTKLGRSVFLRTLRETRVGCVDVVLPDGTTERFGDLKPNAMSAKVTIKQDIVFERLIKSADLGFADAYMNGELDVDHLTNLIKILILNREHMNNLDTGYAWLNHVLDKVVHWSLANVVGKAKDNVAAHYDLSNDMFALFLDPTMSYSSAFFTSEKETLEQAQMNKIRMMIRKAHVKSTDHVLEIGSGWGALAMEAVRMTGCRVTSLTLSEEQKKLADERIAAAGLSDRIEIKLSDYRDFQGTFDKVISVEMIEQVGHEFLGTYFKCIERFLKPDGIAVIQAITLADHRYAGYLKGCDFIQKYIFPGSCLPCISAMTDALARETELVVDDIENIGPHYARTLRMWQDAFNANADKVRALGFDERFIRMWNYYFSYCEAAFATRTIGDVQLVLARPGAMELSEGVPE